MVLREIAAGKVTFDNIKELPKKEKKPEAATGEIQQTPAQEI